MATKTKYYTEFQSEYKNVCLQTDHQFHGTTIYLKASTERSGMHYWYESAQVLDQCEWNDTEGKKRLHEHAARICPIWHGSAGPHLSVMQIRTGAY